MKQFSFHSRDHICLSIQLLRHHTRKLFRKFSDYTRDNSCIFSAAMQNWQANPMTPQVPDLQKLTNISCLSKLLQASTQKYPHQNSRCTEDRKLDSSPHENRYHTSGFSCLYAVLAAALRVNLFVVAIWRWVSFSFTSDISLSRVWDRDPNRLLLLWRLQHWL